jgi:hypothetical protein
VSGRHECQPDRGSTWRQRQRRRKRERQQRGRQCVGHDIDAPSIAATPELDSVVLFGTGAAGIVGYGLMRLRARRRQD